MTKDIKLLQEEAICLLKQLISIPSFSKQEDKTAEAIMQYLKSKQIDCIQVGNNIIARNYHFDESKPVVLLNSHHDTVKPNTAYTMGPFEPVEQEGKLFGLGSNDAGGCLVSLIACFVYFYRKEHLPFNLVLAATAEEEISGNGGIELVLNSRDFASYTAYTRDRVESWAAIVGEPTLMQMAIAEKGLMVIDACAYGKAGHAARDEGENALYMAIEDIQWLARLRMEKISPFLGPVKITVTVIDTDNKQHNVIPASCHFTIDVRFNERYTAEELLEYLRSRLKSRLRERSIRLRATMIPLEHPLVRTGMQLQKEYYGSPTTSDKALIPFAALKMGPGDSARSHTADEFIYLEEVKNGVAQYIEFIQKATTYYE